MRRLLLSVLMALAAGGVWAPLSAQDSALSSEERLRLLFSTLGPADEVQIVTPLFFVENARFAGIDGSQVNLTQGGTTVPLDLVDIRAVSVRANHQWQGALWGFGTGALIGGITGMMVGSFDCVTTTGCNDTEREGAIRWGSFFGVTGALTGFVIGRTNVYWRPLFP